ncbi:S8 family peptidase [Methylocucumis oryzae]|uniref:S8 family peptidase n=1 Tax=Methylocucumis oryzae TaxID=1632867 RepID=UPI000698A11C|nr:S8 family peptidase [Methylocucumis oryzae]
MPNDNLFSELWGMNNTGQTGGTANADINAPEAWDRITGNSSVTVGIIDTGIDYRHADLLNNLWRNLKEFKGVAGVDDDGNGYIDDLYGIDTYNGDNDPLDDNSHGTHVAGTIGGVGNNAEGVTGVAWNVKMAACKFLNASGNGDTSGAIECINYFNGLRAQGENIVATNNSWGGGDFSQLLKDAIDASATAGILFIAAAGNDTNNNDLNPSYPASYESSNIIAVAATDHTDSLADFSNYGATSVDIAAPGVDILSSVLTTSGCPAFSPESAAVYHDGFEAGLGQWSLLGYLGSNPIYNNPSYWWQQNNAVNHTGASSASDSLSGNYANSTVSSMTKGLNLSAVSSPLCGGLWLKGQAEYTYDYLYIYLSKDGGATWAQTIGATGTFSDWTKVTFAIPEDFKNVRLFIVFSKS